VIEFGMALMTLGILQFTIIPLFADLNRSHATNPDWPGHARNHLVTQVLTTSSLGLIALYFMWSGRVSFDLGVCIAMICSAAALAPFFISALTSPLFGGQLMPARIGLGRIHFAHIEGNALNFGVSAAMLVIGRLILL
jgi:hypothetical protein